MHRIAVEIFLYFQVIARAGNRPPPNRAGHFDGGISVGTGRQITHEMFIPGAKCGLVIGKGGETIKNIQVFIHLHIIVLRFSLDFRHFSSYFRNILVSKW